MVRAAATPWTLAIAGLGRSDSYGKKENPEAQTPAFRPFRIGAAA
jgi:hypothetical protein